MGNPWQKPFIAARFAAGTTALGAPSGIEVTGNSWINPPFTLSQVASGGAFKLNGSQFSIKYTGNAMSRMGTLHVINPTTNHDSFDLMNLIDSNATTCAQILTEFQDCRYSKHYHFTEQRQVTEVGCTSLAWAHWGSGVDVGVANAVGRSIHGGRDSDSTAKQIGSEWYLVSPSAIFLFMETVVSANSPSPSWLVNYTVNCEISGEEITAFHTPTHPPSNTAAKLAHGLAAGMLSAALNKDHNDQGAQIANHLTSSPAHKTIASAVLGFFKKKKNDEAVAAGAAMLL